MKKFTKFVAAVMALTLAAGTVAFAADSSTTTNTTVAESSSSSSDSGDNGSSSAAPAAVYPDYIVYRDSTSTVTRAAAVRANSGLIRVASDYAEVPDTSLIATAIRADKAVAKALTDYINILEPGKTVIGPIKIQMYRKGVALADGFGTFRAIIGVGAKYNGLPVTAYIYHQDGTVEKLSLTVTNGRVVVPFTSVGTVALVF